MSARAKPKIARAHRLLRWLHWFLGLTLGGCLSFMALSGVMMSFEDEIMLAISPQTRVTAPGNSRPLPLNTLIASLREQRPQETLVSLQIERRADSAWSAAWKRQRGQRNLREFVDPYRGVLLGEANGAAFFATVRNLHRYLAPGGNNPIGRNITGLCAIGLIFFALSGLYLRWAAGTRRLRDWLRPDFRLSGRHFYRMLHGVFGSWLACFYLISAASGLWWSYDSYRQGVIWLLDDAPASLVAPAAKKAPPDRAAPVDWDRVWRQLQPLYGERYDYALIFIPAPGKDIRIRVHVSDGYLQAFDELRINGRSLQIRAFEPFSRQSFGRRILNNMDPIHTGDLFGLSGRILMAISSFCIPLFFITGLLMYWKRRRAQRAASDARSSQE
ncbi:PepSY domain-containing protein [Affinibrenneria salicis]|uniref:PepSY domain-containing protein n=1 Tax=Affinibrenneria salicis TaxID=2590031 RepID=A0A5J5G1H7_9GAMM|nr:PepSY-associated TM helix domain-containing protein [Affinibrenneria salicis]KAA9000511.1 PepSY domain-containing protein [Affinibrenneria salicis]